MTLPLRRRICVLAPNSPLRAAVTAMAAGTPATTAPAPSPPATEPIHRTAARYAWALLRARIDEVFPLRCPLCGAQIIAFIIDGATVRPILAHLGAPISAPTVAPARGPPLWAALDAAPSDALALADTVTLPTYEFNQRIAW